MALAGDHAQILVGGYELSGDMQRVSVDDSRTLYDVTAFADAAHAYIPGRRQMGLDHTGYMNSDAARSHPVLKDAAVNGVVSLLLGSNSPPAVGNAMFSLMAEQEKYATLPEMGKFVPFSARFANTGGQSGWGVALAVPVSFTNTTTGSGVNNGAPTTKGGAAFLHLLQAAATDRYSIIVEGASDAGFTTGLVTLATFTLNASALGSERMAIAGTIPQFARFKATRVSGSANNPVRIAVGLVRF